MATIQSVDRALSILNLFDEQRSELKITEISNMMGLHKSTIHGLLKSLQQLEYIEQDLITSKYRLGMKLLERSSLLIQNMDIRQKAHPYLQDISSITEQTVHLVIKVGLEAVYLDKVDGTKAVIKYSRIGKKAYFHSTAVGKIIFSFSQASQQRDILHHYTYIALTPNTIINEQEFLRESEIVRQQGYAWDREENELGVHCYAVPIRDYTQEVIAAISISMLAHQMNITTFERIQALMQQTAEKLSKEMGYQSSR